MSRVWSCNEWDPLEEVIVGNPLKARYPTPDLSTQLAEFPDRSLANIPRGPFPQRIIEETEEDLEEFEQILEKAGVTVKRPDTWPHEATFSTINWESQGYYNYCPRDIMLVIGDQIIETPNVIRSRAQETFSYRTLLIDYMKSGARWYSAPKPMLLELAVRRRRSGEAYAAQRRAGLRCGERPAFRPGLDLSRQCHRQRNGRPLVAGHTRR